jgi:F-type H+-transporting ATPase subunit epsilon
VRVFVKGGLAEIDTGKLTVLAERAIPVEAMDAATVAAELETAQAELAAAHDDAARLAAATAVDRLKAMGR